MKIWKGDYPFFNTVVLPTHQCLMLSSICCKPKAKYKRQFRNFFGITAEWRKSGSPIAGVLCSLIEALQKSTLFEQQRSSDEIRVAYEEDRRVHPHGPREPKSRMPESETA
mmetsp:Transcript_16168/g.23923  ORF Transcript_16168/g.23923 Transcript_16168/m.23923 type:complete len:111 (-) Transcript_16168:26-358(-)